jgi:D-3-phosphoglycerate dehydrogenase
MQVAFLEPQSDPIKAMITRLAPAGMEILFAETRDAAEHASLIARADYAIAWSSPVTAAMITEAPRLRMIQRWGVGVDRIDLATAEQRGVAVAVTTGTAAIYVAELTVSLMLAVLRRIVFSDESVRRGDWPKEELHRTASSLVRKQVGLIGLGNIGRAVGRLLRGFDCRIVSHSRRRYPDAEAEGFVYSDLDTLLETSDVVSLHCPLTEETRELIGYDALDRMKPTAVLINVARAGLVVEPALIDALVGGGIAAAGIDVFEEEPPPRHHPLLGLPNVVLTPHAGGSLQDNVAAMARHSFGNIAKYDKGEPLAPADIVVAGPA